MAINSLIVKGLLLSIWLALFVGGLLHYSGSLLVYTMFSVVFMGMLISGFYRQVTYGYLFLVVFLWLGFWLKLTVHLILAYDYVEPMGSFNGAATAWDEVLQVALVASIGVILGRVLYGLAGNKPTMVIREARSKAPAWYPISRKCLWISIMAATAGLAIVNAVYGIHQVGLVPRTIFPWPLNAGIAWMLNIGLATGIAALLWWDIVLRKNISYSIYTIFVEALFSSISILSRGVYIFHAIPQMLTLYKNKQALAGISRIKKVLIAVIFVGLFIVSLSVVNTFRGYLYQHGGDFTTKTQINLTSLDAIIRKNQQLEMQIQKSNPLEKQLLEKQLHVLLEENSRLEKSLLTDKAKWEEAARSGLGQSKMLIDEFAYQIAGGVSERILQLAVDRWIGLEGVMAVQSYPDKGEALILGALKEKREIGKVDSYQKICNSIYLKSDVNKYQFGSLPGPSAFLYYSGSLWVVVLGMAVFALLVLFIERLIDMLTANPLLCSLYGFTVANMVAQFGLAPRQDIPFFFMLFFGILAIWFVQSKLFSGILQKLGLFKAATV